MAPAHVLPVFASLKNRSACVFSCIQLHPENNDFCLPQAVEYQRQFNWIALDCTNHPRSAIRIRLNSEPQLNTLKP
jgi:hypothetical protein